MINDMQKESKEGFQAHARRLQEEACGNHGGTKSDLRPVQMIVIGVAPLLYAARSQGERDG
jgi:hypothetical protein